MENKVELSIVVPIYKVEKYLDRCVKSIISQMDMHLEIIFVDDGSPDRCPFICDEYADKYDNIKVIHKKNGGLADAVKAGTLIASGKYIAYVDSDDWLEDGWYSIIKSILTKHPDIDTIMYGFQRVTNDVVEMAETYPLLEEGYYDESSIEKVKATYMRPGGIGPTRWNKIYSKEIALKCIEYYDTNISIGEDMVFSAIATDLMKNTYIIKKNFVNYYINDGSMTQHFNEKYKTSFDSLFLSLKKYFDGAPILYYINYINMRTMVNAVGKSDLNNKSQYLKVIFNDEEIHDRLKKVDKKYLDLSNRILLDMMLKNQTKFLLIISYIYRKVK